MKVLAKPVILFLTALLLCACSSEQRDEPEPGRIDTMTSEAAQQATQMIKEPMDKARAAAEIENARIQKMEENNN